MRLRLLPLLTVLAVAACDKSQPAPANPEPTPAPATEPAPATDPVASAEAQPAKETPEEAQRKRLEAALKELEAEYAKEGARWNDELKASTKKLVETNWKSTKQALQAALKSPHRRPEHAARDQDRHPSETLAFFGLKPTMRVFELGPSGGWYSELLAVVLGKKGKLVHASYPADAKDPQMVYMARGNQLLLQTAPELYGNVETVLNQAPDEYNMGPPESLDMVLAFRMAHNLVRWGTWEKFLAKSFETLKPGGVLAIEQHRAAAGADPKETAPKGYLPEAWVIEQVEAAGFKLEKKSEINANPKDTKDYPKGVWTLPPNFAEGETDKAKYAEIGESDRMTLKFVKPKTKAKPKADKGAAAGDAKGGAAGKAGGGEKGQPKTTDKPVEKPTP